MYAFSTTVAVLALVAMVVAQSVISDFGEYQRKKAEYDRQKAKYDEFQSLAGVPVLASYDLIPKKGANPRPGTAELLLPEFTGEKVNFRSGETASNVEAGNTAQNFFHTGPIPAKKSTSPSPGPIAIPTGPGQDFIIPEQQSDAPVEEVPAAPAPDISGAPAPPPPEAASVAAFAAPEAVEVPVAEVPAPPVPAGAALPDTGAPSASGQALFFGRGALPAAFAQADAPFQASAEYAAPAAPAFASFEGSSSAVNVALREESIRQRAPAPIPAAPAPLPLPAPAAAAFSFIPAQTYGPPGF